MVERHPDPGVITDAQLLVRVWDWAGQALEPIDADSIARGAATRVPLLSRFAFRVAARATLAPAARWPVYGFLILLALLASLLAGAFFVGSRHRDIPEQRLPPPFGAARNGVIVLSVQLADRRSNLVQLDPATGETETLRSGGWLVGPVFSNDGRQILFGEAVGGRAPRLSSSLWVMSADGSGARQLLPVGRYGDPAWSPEGDSILVGGEGGLFVIDVARGTSVLHSLGIDIEFVSWRPNHEQALLSVFNGHETYLVNADGTGLRSLPAWAAWGYWSPDGSTVVYNVPTQQTAQDVYPDFVIHVLDVDGGVDRQLTFDGHPGSHTARGISPDGTTLLVWRRTGIFDPGSCGIPDCEYYRPILVPVAGGGPEVRLGSFDVVTGPGDGGWAIFSPDARQLVGVYSKDPKGVWLYEADTGKETAMTGPPWESSWWGMTWQRLAP